MIALSSIDYATLLIIEVPAGFTDRLFQQAHLLLTAMFAAFMQCLGE